MDPKTMDSRHRQWVMTALNEHEQRLTRYVARLFNGRIDLAGDVVQHAFLKLCHQDRNAIGDNVAAWLFRVCRNRAFDEMRKQKMSIERSSLAARENLVDSCQHDDLERGELMGELQTLIEKLPAEQREAIDLWSNGIRFREIGEVLGKTEVAVRVSVHRAIKQLRESQIVRSHLAAEAGDQMSSVKHLSQSTSFQS